MLANMKSPAQMKGISSPTTQREMLRNVKPKQKKEKIYKHQFRENKREVAIEKELHIAPRSKMNELLKHNIEPKKPNRQEHVR